MDVLHIHTDQIARYGGGAGIRDMGALESALFRPQTGYYKDLIAEAAALMESLATNHPFLDDNKRVAFAAVDVFLRINGHRLTVDPGEAYRQIMHWFDMDTLEFVAIEEWLRKYVHHEQPGLQ